jgi:hypothetical protein
LPEDPGMHEWLHSQPAQLCQVVDPPHHKTIYYISPELLTLFLLRWS